jgi:predicted NACHT family NTPase
MDSRFLSTYDPTLDVQIDLEGHDDFNDAVEAYRDRQKWKQQGAERMRSAGFSDDFVKAWENNDTKNEANLKWTKKGATREWDRGKTLEDLDGGGGVDLRADWIKKK